MSKAALDAALWTYCKAIGLNPDNHPEIEEAIRQSIEAYEAAKKADQPDHCREAFETYYQERFEKNDAGEFEAILWHCWQAALAPKREFSGYQHTADCRGDFHGNKNCGCGLTAAIVTLKRYKIEDQEAK